MWFFVRYLEVPKGTTAYTNLLCSKVDTIALHCILRTNMKNLPWKNILMWNDLTSQLKTDHRSNALIARSVSKKKTFLVIIEWWCNVPNTRGRHFWRCTPHGWKLNQKNSHNWGTSLGRVCLGNRNLHMQMKQKTHPKRLHFHLNKGKQLVCLL